MAEIFDFSTLYLRRKFCRIEIDVNKVLCGDMYKGIVKLVCQNNGSIKIVDLQTKGKPFNRKYHFKGVDEEIPCSMITIKGRVVDQTTKGA